MTRHDEVGGGSEGWPLVQRRLTIGAAMVGFAGPLASPADAVPNCVTTSLDDDGAIDYLTVRNTCSTTQRVKVVIAYNPDFACQTFAPGTRARYQWGYPGRFDGLADC